MLEESRQTTLIQRAFIENNQFQPNRGAGLRVGRALLTTLLVMGLAPHAPCMPRPRRLPSKGRSIAARNRQPGEVSGTQNRRNPLSHDRIRGGTAATARPASAVSKGNLWSATGFAKAFMCFTIPGALPTYGWRPTLAGDNQVALSFVTSTQLLCGGSAGGRRTHSSHGGTDCECLKADAGILRFPKTVWTQR